MSFIASIIFACAGLFMAVISGYAVSRLKQSPNAHDRKDQSHAVVLSAVLAVAFMTAALMIAVSAR